MAFFTRQQLITKSQQIRKSMHFSKNASTILTEQAGLADTQTFDIFLSHSYQDADLVFGLKEELEGFGHSVYVDWIVDQKLDRSKVTPRTADTIRKRMRNCRSLIYATSQNAISSKWMPWELGYFDGIKGKVAILPIMENGNAPGYEGQEYLGLYPYVTTASVGGIFHASTKLRVNTLSGSQIILENWLVTGASTPTR